MTDITALYQEMIVARDAWHDLKHAMGKQLIANARFKNSDIIKNSNKTYLVIVVIPDAENMSVVYRCRVYRGPSDVGERTINVHYIDAVEYTKIGNQRVAA